MNLSLTLSRADAFIANADAKLQEYFEGVSYIQPKPIKVIHPQQPKPTQSRPVQRRQPYVAGAGEIIL